MQLKYKVEGAYKTYCPIPVHGVYLSLDSSNPSAVWPGTTWRKVTGGLLACAGTTGYAAAGSTGGSKKISIAQMPSHTHRAYSRNWWVAKGSDTGCGANYNEEIGDWGVQPTGGGQTTTRFISPSTCGRERRSVEGGASCELGSRTGTGSSTTVPTPSGHGFIASSTRTENGLEPAGRGMARARISSRRARRTRVCRTTARTRMSSLSVRCRLIHMLGMVTGCALALVEPLMEWQRGGEPGTSPWFTTLGRVAEGHTITCHIPWPSPFGGVWGSLSTSWGGGCRDDD